jgi:hypothetical protein
MKSWLLGLVCFAFCSSVTWAAEPHAPVPVKDKDGKTYAMIVFCNDCADPTKAGCYDGAENGFLKGAPCGKCFIEQSERAPIPYPYDVHITGVITKSDGTPVKERFVKLFMSNGWGHRTRTLEDGRFHLVLGATAERKSKDNLSIDLGTLVDGVGEGDQHYAMYFLPVDFKPCAKKASGEANKKDIKGRAQKSSLPTLPL